MRLQGKVALVTGAGSGIGAAIAERFAAEGARAAINVRPGGKHSGVEVQARIEKRSGGAVIIVPADVTERASVQQMVERIVAQYGRLDIAVNNAGIEIKRPFVDVTDQEWNKVLGVDLHGAFLVSQLTVRQMLKQGGGKLIFVSSVHEDIPFLGYTSYCAAKGAIRMMMRNLAMELAPNKINVNNIAPGAIATPINQKVLEDPQQKRNALEEIPWGRFGRAEEVAAVAAFLASDEADYVSGSTYYIDGGLTQQVTKY